MDNPSTVKVTILDKEYRVACPEDSRFELESAARFLDQKMREIKTHGRVFGLDRIAVMAALNLAHSHLVQQKSYQAQFDRVRALSQKIDHSLNSPQKDPAANKKTPVRQDTETQAP